MLKRIAFNEKQIVYKEKGFDHTEKSFAYIHKTNPRQIATTNSQGKKPRQIATANNHYRYMKRGTNNVIFNTCCNKKKFHVLSFNLR